jgi:hypothetical protein
MTAPALIKIDLVVEIFYSSAWHVVPVYTRDQVSITGATPNFGAVSSPASCTLSIQNTSELYSPDNPSSALYGLIGVNTPLRVTADGVVEFDGEIETWAQRWEQRTDVDKWVVVTAYGISRRLNRPGVQAPELSALARAYRSTGTMAAGLLAYWSLEDEVDADAPASGVTGLGPLTLRTGVTMGASRDQQNGSLPYAVLDGSVATALTAAFVDVTLPTSTAGFFAFGATFKGTMPRPSVAKAVIYQGARVYFATGAITDAQINIYAKWTGTAFDTTNCGVDIVLTGGTSFGSVIGGVGTFNLFDGLAHDIQVRIRQSGADVIGELWIDGILADDATSTTKTLGAPNLLVGPYVSIGALGGTTVDAIDTTLGFGHFAINTSSSVGTLHDAATGHVGETAADRIERVFTEDGIPITIVGTAAESELMGPQVPASLLSIVGNCVEVDQGLLYDTRDSLGITYRTIGDLYNQAVALPLVMNAGGHVAHPLYPVTDTQNTLNDATVERFQGGKSRVQQLTGPRNVSEPTVDPQGVGRYPRRFRLYLAADSQTGSQAGWRVHVGTSTDARYPSIRLDLSAMALAGLTALKAAAATLDPGDRLTIANLPATAGPDAADQLMLGYTHEIGPHSWVMTLNAGAASPYEVFELESTTGNRGRISPAPGKTTVNEALDTTETGVDIVSVTQRFIDSATYPTMFPFDVIIGGERMTVTAITGTGLTQTMTVVRSVNGIVKAHSAGAAVALFRPAVLAL